MACMCDRLPGIVVFAGSSERLKTEMGGTLPDPMLNKISNHLYMYVFTKLDTI